MKKAAKKLSLSRETIYQLQVDELPQAQGGASTQVCVTTVKADSCCPRSSCLC